MEFLCALKIRELEGPVSYRKAIVSKPSKNKFLKSHYIGKSTPIVT